MSEPAPEPASYFLVWLADKPIFREWYGRHYWQPMCKFRTADRDPHPDDAVTKAATRLNCVWPAAVRDDPRYRIVTYDELVAIIASTRAQHALEASD